ncbi:unnamed protein product [Prunus armeniaca]
MALPCGLVKQSPGWIVSPICFVSPAEGINREAGGLCCKLFIACKACCQLGRLCQIFGRKSRSLVSGPGIGVMSEFRRGPSRFPRRFGAGPISLVSEH